MLAMLGPFGAPEIVLILILLAGFALSVAVVVGVVWLCTRKKP